MPIPLSLRFILAKLLDSENVVQDSEWKEGLFLALLRDSKLPLHSNISPVSSRPLNFSSPVRTTRNLRMVTRGKESRTTSNMCLGSKVPRHRPLRDSRRKGIKRALSLPFPDFPHLHQLFFHLQPLLILTRKHLPKLQSRPIMLLLSSVIFALSASASPLLESRQSNRFAPAGGNKANWEVSLEALRLLQSLRPTCL